MSNLPNANDAHAQTSANELKIKELPFNTCVNKIIGAINKGEYETNCDANICEQYQQKLRDLGYNVNIVETDYGCGQRDERWCNVSWIKPNSVLQNTCSDKK
jgi:hypothetical protein